MRLFLLLFVATITPAALSQTVSHSAQAGHSSTSTKPDSSPQGRQKFVLDVVQSAVALPQSDPQDRLRVLSAATAVVAPIDSAMAQRLAKEGTVIETKLVAEGQRPAVSMLAGGHVDCTSAATFVLAIPPSAVLDAEQSLVGAITTCPAQVNEAARLKLDAALNQGVVAGRPILALMEAAGMKSTWSQAVFAKMFASLPADAPAFAGEAPNYAAMFARAAPAMDTAAVKTAGSKFLLWLAKLPDMPERQVAVNLTTGAMQDVLGAASYQEVLRSDVMVQQIAGSAGTGAVLPAPDDDNVSVLRAMGNRGDRKMADHYFDIAFSSAEEVWSDRSSSQVDAPEVVQEVSEAAAQVDPVAALQRAERLQDPSEEAISMLAVARVVGGQP